MVQNKSVRKTCEVEYIQLNQLYKITVLTELQLLLILWFIKHVKIFEFVIWHMQQKLIKYYMLLLRFELYMLSDSF